MADKVIISTFFLCLFCCVHTKLFPIEVKYPLLVYMNLIDGIHLPVNPVFGNGYRTWKKIKFSGLIVYISIQKNRFFQWDYFLEILFYNNIMNFWVFGFP